MENRTSQSETLVFNGDDIEDLFFRAKKYFNTNQITNWEKIEAVGVCFEGKSLA